MTRIMTVSYAPSGDGKKPMIRIANSLLTHSGFSVGTKIAVSYQGGIITINKTN